MTISSDEPQIQLDPTRPVAEQIGRLIGRQLQTAIEGFDQLPADKAVHETRKMLKRLRAVLRLARDLLGEPQYQRLNVDYRDVGRLLAGRREQAALLEIVDKLGLATQSAVYDEVLTQLRQRLAAQQAANPVADAEWGNVARDALRRLAADADAIDLATTDEKTAWLNGLRRSYRQGRRRMAAARSEPSADNLHEWRKSVKHLWTQHQLLEAADPLWYRTRAEQWHALSDALGDDHDLHELRCLLEADPALAGDAEAQAALFMLIDNERHRLQDEAWQLGATLFAEKPAAFAKRANAQWTAAERALRETV